MNRGTRIVLTAPFTEMIDHTGYFIQMGMASIPIWMEWVTAAEFGRDNVVVCYPHDLDQFIGPDTGIVALSTHNPLGVTFAAGVYTSIFGSSREPTNSHYAAKLFGFLVPSVFTPLEGTRMEHGEGVTETRNLSRLQWQLILRCWELYATGKLYKGQPIKVKTRAELLTSIKPNYWKYLREDAGDIPAAPPPPAPSEAVPQLEAV